MSAHVVAVVPANVGLETATTAIAVVEFVDTWETRGRPRRHAVRDVLAVRTEPVDRSIADVAGEVAEVAAPLGPLARVIVNTGGSPSARAPWIDAWRGGEFARPVRTVTIAGEGLTADEWGLPRVGEFELVSNLRELVKGRGFTLPPEGEGLDVVAAAMNVEPSVTEAGRLKFPSRQRDGRVFALALAMYPQWTPAHGDRRYRTQGLPPDGKRRVFESFRDAEALIGQLARG